MIKQKTLDLLDSELRDKNNKYLKYDYEDRFKIFSHDWRIDPDWSEKKYTAINKYGLKWSKPFKYSKHPDLDKIIKSNDSGIYIFFVAPPQLILNMPQYVIYVGISGEGGSGRPLKDRLKDYFYFSKIKLRKGIHKALQLYYEHTYFAFALYNGNYKDLEDLETLLHEYFSPKWSSRDYEPETKAAKSSWGII